MNKFKFFLRAFFRALLNSICCAWPILVFWIFATLKMVAKDGIWSLLAMLINIMWVIWYFPRKFV